MFYADAVRRVLNTRQEIRYTNLLQKNAKKHGDNITVERLRVRRECCELELVVRLQELKG
jgi:hypothetical protein